VALREAFSQVYRMYRARINLSKFEATTAWQPSGCEVRHDGRRLERRRQRPSLRRAGIAPAPAGALAEGEYESPVEGAAILE
jgi:hypothetical protein